MKKDENAYHMQATVNNGGAAQGEETGGGTMAENLLYATDPAENAGLYQGQAGSTMYTPQVKSYGDIIANIRKQDEVSPVQEEKDRKRQRAMLILGALSDGIAGMANIFAARKGALPVWHDQVTDGLDARYQAVLDQRRRRSAYWNDVESRIRMSDLSGKLSGEHRNRQPGKIRRTRQEEYGDGIKPHGGQYAYKGVNEEVSREESPLEYDNSTENDKKPTGINW